MAKYSQKSKKIYLLILFYFFKANKHNIPFLYNSLFNNVASGSFSKVITGFFIKFSLYFK